MGGVEVRSRLTKAQLNMSHSFIESVQKVENLNLLKVEVISLLSLDMIYIFIISNAT